MGNGFSYRAIMQRSDSLGQSTTFVDPYVQYNGSHGAYTAEYRNRIGRSQPKNGSFDFSAAGSIVYASGTWGFSRPVDDSFAIIETNRIRNVRVYFNNHEIGATNGAGKIIVPIVNSYVNNILAISDQDIPVNYTLKDVSRHVFPPWKSGTLVRFDAVKTQAFSGRLFLKADNKEQPVEFAEIGYELNKNAYKFMTGRDGEFYLENIPPGQYQANFQYIDRSYSFVLKIPASEEMVIDLGKVTIENRN
jgi:outer membrane usher protein FimD/PapC